MMLLHYISRWRKRHSVMQLWSNWDWKRHSQKVHLFYMTNWMASVESDDVYAYSIRKMVRMAESMVKGFKMIVKIDFINSFPNYISATLTQILGAYGMQMGELIPEYWRSTWFNGYRRRKWTRWHEFKSWMRLIAFHIALIPFQLWANSRTDWVLQPWWGN